MEKPVNLIRKLHGTSFNIPDVEVILGMSKTDSSEFCTIAFAKKVLMFLLLLQLFQVLMHFKWEQDRQELAWKLCILSMKVLALNT